MVTIDALTISGIGTVLLTFVFLVVTCLRKGCSSEH